MTPSPQSLSKEIKPPLRVVGLFARQHGLAGLKMLVHSQRYQVVAVATHRRLPKSEDAERSERTDFAEYVALAAAKGFPLYTVDSLDEQHKLDEALQHLEFDILASISWRRLIPLSTIQRAQVGAVNLHRGKLPEYPGAEPIKQALTNGDSTIAITAHILDEQIDHGAKLCVYEHPVAYNAKSSFDENISRLKQELTPHFGPLLVQAIDTLQT